MASSSSARFFSTQSAANRLVNSRKRPRELQLAIDAEFKQIVSSDGSGYIFRGELQAGYHFATNNFFILLTNEILAHRLQEKNVLAVCDIGAGAFGFEANNKKLFGAKVLNYGISATSFHSATSKMRKIGYNAEYLSDVFGCNQFDFCFSRATFIHFVDPIGSIIEAYKSLKMHGILIIDKFYVLGCEELIHYLIPYLQKQGYRVVGTANDNGRNYVTGFIIQKTPNKPELEFPLHYSTLTSDRLRMTYQPSSELRAPINHSFNATHYQQGVEIVLQRIRANNLLSAIIDEQRSLIELINAVDYQYANTEDRYLLLLGIIATTMPSYAEISRQAQLEAQKNNLFFTLQTIFITSPHISEYYSTLCLLSKNAAFCTLGPESALLLISLAAANNIINFSKAHESEVVLKAMGLPYTEYVVDACYGDPSYLQFAELRRNTNTLTYTRSSL